MPPSRGVPRPLRILNAVTVLLLAVAGAVYVRAWIGMAELARSPEPAEGAVFSAMARFDHFWRLSELAEWLVVAAVGLGVAAAAGALLQRVRS